MTGLFVDKEIKYFYEHLETQALTIDVNVYLSIDQSAILKTQIRTKVYH